MDKFYDYCVIDLHTKISSHRDRSTFPRQLAFFHHCISRMVTTKVINV